MSILKDFVELIKQQLEPLKEEILSLEEKINEIQLKEGPQGEKGEQGDKGEKGDRGEKGKWGLFGKDGINGRDGINGLDGQDGESVIGPSGKDGKDGKDAEVNIDEIIEKVLLKVPRPLIGSGQARKSRMIFSEAKTGNGIATVFTMARAPISIPAVYRSGLRMRVGSANDFTWAGRNITFVSVPADGTNLIFDYEAFPY